MEKGTYSYENRDDSEKINNISLPEKEDLHSFLNMEDIANAGIANGKRICKDF